MTGVMHRFRRKGCTWTCIWCNLVKHGSVVLVTGEPTLVDVGSGPPCTLGVAVTDAVEAKDKLK